MVAAAAAADGHNSPPEPSAPEHALCLVCKEAAVHRCEECFDEEEGHLYLCAKDACFDSTHNARNSCKHRKSLLPWNARAKWVDRCCATHRGNVLALWCWTCSALACALCCSHGEHRGHATSLVADARRLMQSPQQARMAQLDDESGRCGERLRQLTEEHDALASGGGAVGAARRALDEVAALLAAKVATLRSELDMTAEKWSADVAKEHEQLARYTQSVRSLADRMRAACAEDSAGEAQRVLLTLVELESQRDALGGVPPASARGMELRVEPLRQAVTELCVETFPCEVCGATARSRSVASCARCARVYTATLQAEKQRVLSCVAQSGDALYHAREALKADKQVVTTAVAHSGWSLQYASESVRADKQVVAIAVAQNGYALRFASEGLQADTQIVLSAVAQNRNALLYANKDLQADAEVQAYASFMAATT